MRHILIGLSAVLAACGGGGGSTGSKFAGVWRGSFISTTNTCSFIQPSFDVVMTVNEDGERIVLDTDTGRTYEGFVTGGDSFTVARQEQSQCVRPDGTPAPGSFSLNVRSFEFSDVSGDSAIVRFIDQYGDCSGDGFKDDGCEDRSESRATRD